MPNSLKYIALVILSIFVTEAVTLAFFLLRYLTDSLGLPAGWYAVTPFFISLFSSYLIFLLAKKLKLQHARALGVALFVVWFCSLLTYGAPRTGFP